MKRLADQTLYEILEVSPDASPDQIQAAYDKARALYGPGSLVTYTLMEPDEAALLESRIEDARTTLLDPERRARYDEAVQQRQAEPRAAAVASGGAAPVTPPPVIPAAPPPSPSIRDAAPSLAEPVARPAILLGAALDAAGPADAPPPAPAPILLDREVPPEAAAPVEPPAVSVAPAEPPAAETPAPAPAVAGPVVPPPLPETWTGDALRQVREARGLSIPQIAERTKVTRHHIENIEADRFGALPAQVYLRGILLTIARELRLDGQKVARSYIERLPSGTGSAAPKPR